LLRSQFMASSIAGLFSLRRRRHTWHARLHTAGSQAPEQSQRQRRPS
jgi:hypothetical protein